MLIRIDKLDLVTPRAKGDGKTDISELRSLKKANIYNNPDSATRIEIEGELFGAGSKKTLEQLWSMYSKNEPVDFVSDDSSFNEVNKIIFERLHFRQDSGNINRVDYSMTLVSYSEPGDKNKTGSSSGQSTEATSRVDAQASSAFNM